MDTLKQSRRPGTAVTRMDVAHEAKLSLSTVAHALNDHPRVSDKTRERVHEVARRLGFVANAAARRLARQQHGGGRTALFEQVGVIYLSSGKITLDSVFFSMLAGIEHELSDLNAMLILVHVAQFSDWDKVQRLAQRGGVDGWLVVGKMDNAARARLRKTMLPFVIVGDHRCTQLVHSVNVDHAAAASMAVHQLASLGHRRIAYLVGDMAHVFQEQMLQGYRQAVEELGLDDDPELIIQRETLLSPTFPHPGRVVPPWQFARERAASNVKLMRRWLQEIHPHPTAMVTQMFGWASSICESLQGVGLDVPEQMSVIGTESEARNVSELGLTQVETPLTQIGRAGAQWLSQIVAQPQIASNEMKILPRLITGWTTGPARGAAEDAGLSNQLTSHRN